MPYANREQNLRRRARRVGLEVRKSRIRQPDAFDRGLYQVVNMGDDGVVAGEYFDLSLDDAELVVDSVAASLRHPV